MTSRFEQLSLSVVIPAFNERRRLRETLQALCQFADTRRCEMEIIVVDDGSTDRTSSLVRRWADGFIAYGSADEQRWRMGALDIVLLRNESNRGKGYSVRRGVMVATGGWVLMFDADSSARIDQVDKLLKWADEGYPVVIGSRDMPESVLVPAQPWTRRFSASCFRMLRRRIMLSDIRDTQCGFKLFERHAARRIFARQTVDGFLFDCEVLGLARQLGFDIKEVGISWRHDPDSRVHVRREAATAFQRLIQIERHLARSVAS